ncbi:hypothetical protein [Allofournierella sp.]|uniref:hypothetical protein n=1 Tax=Allofournierella sp. TaxID=1940256 RepID=UPI003AB7D0FE
MLPLAIASLPMQVFRKLYEPAQGLDTYFVDHTPQAASGAPFTSAFFQSKGDAITDLHGDMAADGAPF